VMGDCAVKTSWDKVVGDRRRRGYRRRGVKGQGLPVLAPRIFPRAWPSKDLPRSRESEIQERRGERESLEKQKEEKEKRVGAHKHREGDNG